MEPICSRAAIMLPIVFGAMMAPNAQATEVKCNGMLRMERSGSDFKVINAEYIREAKPHCLVQGSFERRTGVDGKPYSIEFAIALPDAWTGQFLVQGGGGLNGVVLPPTGNVAAGGNTALSRGFAVISHDSGHKGEAWDASLKADQIATLNFAGWSVEKVSVVGKALVKQYYGEGAYHSYFVGCFTGGREAMASAQRFPLIFDGIIAGAPAMRTSRSNMSLAAKAVAMNRISPIDKNGSATVRSRSRIRIDACFSIASLKRVTGSTGWKTE